MPTYQLMEISNGLTGIRQTLKIMSKLVKKYKSAPAIRELALSLTGNLPQKDYLGEVRAIHYYVREEIRYIKDTKDVETIQSPIQTLRLKQGDCDDKSSLTAALLESIGHPTRFIAVGFRKGALSHVLVQTKIGKKWINVETTEPCELNWFPNRVKNFMLQHN